MYIDLQKLLLSYGYTEGDMIEKKVFPQWGTSFLRLRDWLLQIGQILYEDLDNQVYVAAIRAGINDQGSAVVAMQLVDGKLLAVGYAREGMIPQHLLETAMEKIEDGSRNRVPVQKKKHHYLWGILIVILICLSIATGILCKNVKEIVTATENYNLAVRSFNESVEGYNHAVSVTSVDNIQGLPDSLDPLREEPETFASAVRTLLRGNSSDRIVADTDTVHEMRKQIDASVNVLVQITAPSDSWVQDRIDQIDGITGSQCVTESLNPDGLLGREGGYSGCVYFTHEAINPPEVSGNNIVEKGTDAGGAIEIYSSLKDAEARCEYLKGFDGTVLYSGSYAILGTMVIRTSYKLTNEQQFQLTSEIADALTEYDLGR